MIFSFNSNRIGCQLSDTSLRALHVFRCTPIENKSYRQPLQPHSEFDAAQLDNGGCVNFGHPVRIGS